MPKFKFIYFITFALLCSCSITSHLPKGEKLIKKNEITIKSPLKLTTKNISKAELLAIAKPAENKQVLGFLKLFGIRFKLKLLFYNAASGGNLTAFKGWVQENLGERYSIYDTAVVIRTTKQMNDYLFNKGYYDAIVDTKVTSTRKKVSVEYIVKPKTLYVVNEVKFISDDHVITNLINDSKGLSLLKAKDAYNSLNLIYERERIELLLRNNGYYNFSQQYIYFNVDSSINRSKKNILPIEIFTESKRPVNIKVFIKNPDDGKHQQFIVNRVLIFPNYRTDSLVQHSATDTFFLNGYAIVAKKLNIKASALLNNIFIQPHITYALNSHQQTATRLSSLGLFRTVNVQYVQTSENQLDCYIFLVQNKKKEYLHELQASTNTDFIGAGINIGFKNKNLFKTADVLQFNLKGSLESPFENTNRQFNVLDLGGQVSLHFPRFLVPFTLPKSSKNENAKTKLSAAYNFLSRQDYYVQNQTNISFGYEWNESIKKRHYLNPVVLSFVRYAEISSAFTDILQKNPLLIGSFQPQFIPGLNYTYTYTTFNPNITKPYTYNFKFFADIAGNLSMLGFNLLNKKSLNQPFEVLGNELSQFSKVDFENRFSYNINKYQSAVFRTATGLALAYGNSSVVPYIKQFYGGGPNGMRGWRARTLGPGKYVDTVSQNYVNQTGDIRLEFNAEYRFNVWSYFKGVLFTDIGNIWLMKPDKIRPGAEFLFNSFYKQFAIDAGTGIRFDYKGYFLIRFDIGFPLVNPALSKNEKWLGNEIKLQSMQWRKDNLKYNLAVGYPF